MADTRPAHQDPDEPWFETPDHGRTSRAARLRAAVVIITVAGAVAATALVVSGHRHTQTAQARVASAIGATLQTGGYSFTYTITETVVSSGVPTSTTAPCPTWAACALPLGQTVTVTGSGTINLSPFAFVASAHISSFGDISVRADQDHVWETGGANYGLTPNTPDMGPGAPLSGLATLTEQTLGDREGAVAMMNLSSPTGYLDLTQPAISNVTTKGAGTEAGVGVTYYSVSVDPTKLVQGTALSTEEVKGANAAVGVLTGQKLVKSTAAVAIDAAGLIRRSTSVAQFADGGTVTVDVQLTAFGCVGRVVMPGQPSTSALPQTCNTPPSTTTTSTTSTTAADTTTLAGTTTLPTTTTVPGTTTVPSPTTVPPSTTAPALASTIPTTVPPPSTTLTPPSTAPPATVTPASTS